MVDPFIVMDLMAKANELEGCGKHIIHMEVGQPSTPAPRSSLEAASKMLTQNKLGYTEALGIPVLRERISKHYQDLYGLSVAPERIVVTTGSSGGFVLAFLACFEAGQRAGLPCPGYPCYRQILKSLGIEPVDLASPESSRWMPDEKIIEQAAREHDIKGLILASPTNPTGTMLTRDVLSKIVMKASELGLWFISDEIYHGLTYEGQATTALEYTDDVIVINSFSKYFSMTGWRIGWMVVPEDMVRVVERLVQNLFISVPTISQFAALAAFDGYEELERNKKVYEKNREILLNELPQAGIDKTFPADGAFYLYADMSRFTDDSLVFAHKMLDEIGVATTPGIDFDPHNGKQYVRFSYARSSDDMVEACKRIKGWL